VYIYCSKDAAAAGVDKSGSSRVPTASMHGRATHDISL
jgi:hypothetical protein